MTLGLHKTVTYDIVGNHVVFLNTATHQVHTLPVEVVDKLTDTTLTLVPGTPETYLTELTETGIITGSEGALTRRKLLAGSGAIAGAGLLAMSLPGVAAASSGVQLPQRTGFWYWDSIGVGQSGIDSKTLHVILLNSVFPEITGANEQTVAIDIDLGEGISVEASNYYDTATVLGEAGRNWNTDPIVANPALARLIALRSESPPPVLPSTVSIAGVAIAQAELTWLSTLAFPGFPD